MIMMIKNTNIENKMTLDEFINKIKNHENVKQGTSVYFNMHDIIKEKTDWYTHDEFTHIPTNTKIIVEYDETLECWSRTSLLLPGMQKSEAIWIGDDEEDCWWKAQHDVTGFEMKVFVELT